MNVLQTPISDDHKSAMFFNGVIATARGFNLETYQDGELTYDEDLFVGEEIIELAKQGAIGDPDVEDDDSPCVQVLVDKFFVITKDGEPKDVENLIYDNYDEAIEKFRRYTTLPPIFKI